MSVKLSFNFSMGLLEKEAGYLLDAAEKRAGEINPRLPEGFVAQMRTLLGQVSSSDSSQKSSTGTLGGLTLAQNAALETVNRIVRDAKDTAKRAFKGETVKLRNEFQVGINSPNDLASILKRARIVHGSCVKEANTAALAAKGWLAADTTALGEAIETLDDADDTQESAKGDRKASTGARNGAANELYEGLLTIQNAANLQWPQRNGNTSPKRAEFRFEVFPPRNGNVEKKPETPAPKTDDTPKP